MVMRYWGATRARPEDFADLVDETRGGIGTRELVARLQGEGWRAFPFTAEGDDVQAHLRRGRPVIALLQVAPGRDHYVVLAAWGGGQVLVHDPALGPYRVESEARLRAAWAATGGWALLLLPPEDGGRDDADASADLATAPSARDGCDAMVDAAVARARATGTRTMPSDA